MLRYPMLFIMQEMLVQSIGSGKMNFSKPNCTVPRFWQHRYLGGCMDQISVKTPNPKCRLYWCLIEFRDWRYSQSCWCFRSILWISAPLTFSLVHPPPPFPRPCVNTQKVQGYVFIQCVTGWGRGSGGPQTDKHLPPSTFTGNFLRKADI